MKRHRRRNFVPPAAVASAVILTLIGLSHITAAKVRSYGNASSIAAVRAHKLTPGPIVTASKLPPRAGCPTTTVSFHSDGLKEYALAQQPPTAAPHGGYPVIIFAHGYTDPIGYQTANNQYSSILNWYCGHGYLVFKPDYRGYGHSEGLPINGLYAPADTYDVLNLAASLPTYPLANAGRIALVGHSMGGGVVLRAGVASHKLPITAIVTLAGAVGSLADITYHWTGHVPPDVASARQQTLAAEGQPGKDPNYWYGASATNYLASLTAPVQIHQGLSDTSVPPSFASNLNRDLAAVNRPHEYYTYPQTGHLFTNPASLGLFLNRSTAFLNEYDR